MKIDNFGRPDWDSYFMDMAYFITIRSIDPRTKHGCIIVDDKHRIVSTGYNGPVRGIDDSKVPLEPEEYKKYAYMEHSERNAIFSAGRSVENCTVYVTGIPCIDCARAMFQSGIKRIVMGKIGSNCVPLSVANVVYEMAELAGVEMIDYQGEPLACFNHMFKYLATKGLEKK